jgi:hypothetical protein
MKTRASSSDILANSEQHPKPRLFHASSNRDLSILEPRNESVRDPEEGPVVFATPDPAYASCFIVNTDDSWTNISQWSNNPDKQGPWVVVVADRNRFLEADRGGVLYELPNETFVTDPDKGTGSSEWVSNVAVVPIPGKSVLYESGLEAMLEHGVQVFFSDVETFNRIKESDDHGLSVVLDMESKHLSENQRLERNVIPILPPHTISQRLLPTTS